MPAKRARKKRPGSSAARKAARPARAGRASRRPSPRPRPGRQGARGASPPVRTVSTRTVPRPRRGRPPGAFAWLYAQLDALEPGKALRAGRSRDPLTRPQIAGIRQAARRWSARCGRRVRTTTVDGMLYLVVMSEAAPRR